MADALVASFSLVTNGWTAGKTHYLVIYASFRVANSMGYSSRVLTISPIKVEINWIAETNMSLIK